MQKCPGCHQRFSYKSVLKLILWGYKPIACPRCGEVSRITFLSRALISIFIVLPTVLYQLLGLSFWLSTLIYLAIALPFLFISPFLVRFQSAAPALQDQRH